MSSIVCQGLQSCLETTEPCISTHKFSPPTIVSRPLPLPQNLNVLDATPRKDYSCNDENKKKNTFDDAKLASFKNLQGGWKVIEALDIPSYKTKEVSDHNKKMDVHPLVKHSTSGLSSKCLKMCTESLGCETGRDTSSDEISSCSWEKEKMQLPTDEHSLLTSQKSQQLDQFSSLSFNKNGCTYRQFTKLNNPKCDFPPPLKSISDSDGVAVKPHREGGRLIINAVAVSSCRTYFEAERTNGRLKLSLHRVCSVDCDCKMNRKDGKVFDTKDEKVLGHEDECSVNCDCIMGKKKDEEVHTTDDENEVLEHENDSEVAKDEVDDDRDEDMEENKIEVGRKFGIGEFPRSSRCKEGGRGGKEMPNWEPFWVAIS